MNGWTYFDNEREPLTGKQTVFDKICHAIYRNGFNRGCQLTYCQYSGYSRKDFDHIWWLGYYDAVESLSGRGLEVTTP